MRDGAEGIESGKVSHYCTRVAARAAMFTPHKTSTSRWMASFSCFMTPVSTRAAAWPESQCR